MSNSILCPITCGFAKIAIYDLFTVHTLNKENDENDKAHKSRERMHQLNLWRERFNGYNNNFTVRYESFVKYGDKVIGNLRSLGKAAPNDKNYTLNIFSIKEWEKMSSEEKEKHEVFKCGGCISDAKLKDALGLFPITTPLFKKVAKEYGIVSRIERNEKKTIVLIRNL